jgi:hypothetical protein
MAAIFISDRPWNARVGIGWRKRVIEINWRDTGIQTIVTEENVTKDYHLVHAWTIEDALKYLIAFKEAMASLD